MIPMAAHIHRYYVTHHRWLVLISGINFISSNIRSWHET
nr:MAG TPA: hypothetical protein [Caudoviricetes sp.]